MRILLTNDDGVHAPGLWALHAALGDGHEVAVVAPDRERSAIGHAITLTRPLRAVPVTVNGGRQAVAVDGTPADCVKFGLFEVLDRRPDLVLAGINPGANVGVNINYSGTVAAAREAVLCGVPGMAVSIQGPDCRHLETAARFARGLVEEVARRGLPAGVLLNVNLPDLPPERIAGVRISRQGAGRLADCFERRTDPRRRDYFWQGADTQRFDDADESDGAALARRFISVTPLRCDLTDAALYERMQAWALTADG